MTNHRKDWNLYVVHFLMKETTKDLSGKLLNESFYISIELFQFNGPEEAYNKVLQMIQDEVLSYAYRDEEGNIIQLECTGLNDMDLLQTNLQKVKNDFESNPVYGLDLATLDLPKTLILNPF